MMSYLFWVLAIGLFIGLIHHLRSADPTVEPVSLREALSAKSKDKQSASSDPIDGILPDVDYKNTEVTKVITAIFAVLVAPFRFLWEKIKELTAWLSKKIERAKNRVLKLEGRKDTENEGEHEWSLLVAVLCIAALIFFTLANYQILKIGMQTVWPVEKRPLAYFFGKPVYAIAVLAIIMIIGEFIFSLMGRRYLNLSLRRSSTAEDGEQSVSIQKNETKEKGSETKEKDRMKEKYLVTARLFYTGLVLFAVIESVLAIIRTKQLGFYENIGGTANGFSVNLPLWVIGIISFAVPLVAAYCFEYAVHYIIPLFCILLIIAAGLIWVAFLLIDLLLRVTHAFFISIIELLALPFMIALPSRWMESWYKGKPDEKVQPKVVYAITENQEEVVIVPESAAIESKEKRLAIGYSVNSTHQLPFSQGGEDK